MTSKEAKHQKLLKLKAVLGDDLSEWEGTGWKSSLDSGFQSTRKEQHNEFTRAEITNKCPKLQSKCHCETPIIWHHIIYNRKMDKFAIVGSECIKRFGNDQKACPKCDKRHSRWSAYCDKCRIRCPLHNVWHRNNDVHTKQMKMPFGKFAGEYLSDLAKTKKSYLNWILTQDWVNSNLKEAIEFEL